VQHGGEGGQQRLHSLAILDAEVLQLLLATHVDARHALAEHLGEIVPCLDLGTGDQAEQERVPLGRHHPLELGGTRW
jgi:hypothetical protein